MRAAWDGGAKLTRWPRGLHPVAPQVTTTAEPSYFVCVLNSIFKYIPYWAAHASLRTLQARWAGKRRGSGEDDPRTGQRAERQITRPVASAPFGCSNHSVAAKSRTSCFGDCGAKARASPS